MEAPERGALMLVRFIAASLVGWTAVELALYYAVCSHNHTRMELVPCAVRSVPFILGMAVLIKSRSLAEWLSDKLDL
jgi:hypothetical protein